MDLTTNDPDGDPVTAPVTSGQGSASIVGGELELSPPRGTSPAPPTPSPWRSATATSPTAVDVTVTVEAADQGPTITAVPEEITVTAGTPRPWT